MLSPKYLAYLHKVQSRQDYREECRVAAIKRDLETHDMRAPSTVARDYLDAIPTTAAESMAIFFALLSAELTKKSRRDQYDRENEESPQQAYLQNIAGCPSRVIQLMRDYDLSRDDAISETARTHGLTPGIVEKALVRASRESLFCRRLEVWRLSQQGLTASQIAKRMAVDRSTIWRDLEKLNRGEHFTRLGRPCGNPVTS